MAVSGWLMQQRVIQIWTELVGHDRIQMFLRAGVLMGNPLQWRRDLMVVPPGDNRAPKLQVAAGGPESTGPSPQRGPLGQIV